MPVPLIQDETLVGEPVLTRITANIVRVLEEMTTASSGTYKNATVYQPNPASAEEMVDYRMTVVQGQPEQHEGGDANEAQIEGFDAPYGVTAWLQPYEIVCEVVQPQTSATPIDYLINRIWADVVRELMKDVKRGGLAWDTKPVAPEMYEVDPNGLVGKITVIVHVIYRTLTNDLYKTPGE